LPLPGIETRSPGRPARSQLLLLFRVWKELITEVKIRSTVNLSRITSNIRKVVIFAVVVVVDIQAIFCVRFVDMLMINLLYTFYTHRSKYTSVHAVRL
jgi:hypothetical protein